VYNERMVLEDKSHSNKNIREKAYDQVFSLFIPMRVWIKWYSKISFYTH
jgi:hypothetical protein